MLYAVIVWWHEAAASKSRATEAGMFQDNWHMSNSPTAAMKVLSNLTPFQTEAEPQEFTTAYRFTELGTRSNSLIYQGHETLF